MKEGDNNMDLVQIYLVDRSLRLKTNNGNEQKLGMGKVAGQCAHGALMANSVAQSMWSHGEEKFHLSPGEGMSYRQMYDDWYENNNQTKILKRCVTADLDRGQEEFKLAVAVIDAGRTEVEPGTRTVVVLPVMDEKDIPQWVRELPLL